MMTGVVNPYPLADGLLGPVLCVAMPRTPRLIAPGRTVHVVSRCNNREFYFNSPDDFLVLLDHLREMSRTYDVVLYASALMVNHVHLLLQGPATDALGRPLHWLMKQTAKAFHKARHRRGHFWERRYRRCFGYGTLYYRWNCFTHIRPGAGGH